MNQYRCAYIHLFTIISCKASRSYSRLEALQVLREEQGIYIFSSVILEDSLKINWKSGAQWRISSLLFQFQFQSHAGIPALGKNLIKLCTMNEL